MATTWNVAKDAPSPPVHPCQKKLDELDDSEKDFGDLQNKLQRHTRCAVGSCLVTDNKQKNR